MTTARRVGLHVVAPVAVGALIYLLFRSPDLLVFDWAEQVGLAAPLSSVRDFTLPARSVLPSWFVFSVPDGLWVYGLTAAMALIWGGHISVDALPWLASGLVLGGGGELGQMPGLVPGTFDLVDLVMVVGAFVLALSIPARERWTCE